MGSVSPWDRNARAAAAQEASQPPLDMPPFAAVTTSASSELRLFSVLAMAAVRRVATVQATLAGKLNFASHAGSGAGHRQAGVLTGTGGGADNLATQQEKNCATAGAAAAASAGRQPAGGCCTAASELRLLLTRPRQPPWAWLLQKESRTGRMHQLAACSTGACKPPPANVGCPAMVPSGARAAFINSPSLCSGTSSASSAMEAKSRLRPAEAHSPTAPCSRGGMDQHTCKRVSGGPQAG